MGSELYMYSFTAILKLYISYDIKIFIFLLRKQQLFKCDCKNQTIQLREKIVQCTMTKALFPIYPISISLPNIAYRDIKTEKNIILGGIIFNSLFNYSIILIL